MGKRYIPGGLIGWVVLIVLFLVVNAIDNRKYQTAFQSIKSESTIPQPIPGKKALFYSSMKGVWIYEESVGAKASNNDYKPYRSSDEYIEEYLQRHIPAYKKKTYWGEEIDIPDILFDDEGDDYVLDPDHRIK